MSNAQQVTPLRKITVKSVFGAVDIEKVLAAENKVLPIMKVYGVVADTKAGASDYGDYVRFLGQFRAVNEETGEMFRASVMLLPKFLEEELAALMASGAQTAEFAVRISAVYDKSVATKYVYIADSLVEAQASSALTALEERIFSAPALANKEEPAKPAKSRK